MITTIIITKRDEDFHARLEGQSGIWGCGKTKGEAVTELIETHSKNIGIAIVWDQSDGYTKRYLDKTFGPQE